MENFVKALEAKVPGSKLVDVRFTSMNDGKIEDDFWENLTVAVDTAKSIPMHEAFKIFA